MTPLRIVNPRRHIAIARDAHGVPHVTGGTWLDALYGLGYMHAIDRPTQMLFGRAVASGERPSGSPTSPSCSKPTASFAAPGCISIWTAKSARSTIWRSAISPPTAKASTTG